VGEVGVTADVIGRTAELEAVDLFLEWIAGGLASVVIDGDAGIGKTALWRASLHRASHHGAPSLGARAI
jgi:predicted ATPase